MNRALRTVLTLMAALCLLLAAVPVVLLPASAATTTTVYDFNGTDFGTSLKTSNIGSGVSLVNDGSAPSGFTDAVMSGTGAAYVSVGVDFAKPIDTSKVTAIKVRMYVPTYTLTGTPQLRILSHHENTNQAGWEGKAFVAGFGGAFDRWCELDITAIVKNTILKDADGYLDYFAIGYRTYGNNAVVYYDSISITYEGDSPFVEAPETPVSSSEYDFNGTDFASPQTTHGAVSSVDHIAKPTTNTASVPAGFTGGVYSSSHDYFNAAWVDFGERALDLTKVTSVKVRLYITSYTTSAPVFRLFGTIPTSYAQVAHDGTYDRWFELELLDLLTSSSVGKNADGTVSKFLIAYRTYGSASSKPTVYFDRISVSYTGDSPFVGGGAEETPADGRFDFNGQDFDTPTEVNNYVSDTGSFATTTASAPSGYTGGVYSKTHSTYVATWIKLHGKLDLSKATSVRLRLYIPTYTKESAGATPVFRVFGTGGEFEALTFDGTYDQWIEVELLNTLKANKVTKLSDGTLNKFLFSLRTYGNATVYFDELIIEGEGAYIEAEPISYIDASPTSIIEQHSGQAPNQDCWNIYLSAANNSAIPGTPWVTKFDNVPVEINGTTRVMQLMRAETTNGTYLKIEYKTLPKDNAYAVVTVKAGKYDANDGGNGIEFKKDFTFYIYNDDAWNAAPPQNYTVDVTFERLDDAVSLVHGSKWDMYPVPYGAAGMPGTPWKTIWAVDYEVDGVPYVARMMRAANEQGLYFPIESTIVSPAADGVTIVVKAGTYVPTSDSLAAPSLRITEDFTFYVIGGKAIGNFNFDDPKFSAAVTVNADKAAYVVEEGADSATIDGVAVTPGSLYDVVGTHTLVYTKWERTYTRKVVIYRLGEVGDTQTIDVCDVVIMKRYLAGETEFSEAASWGADLNVSGTVDKLDMGLLRKQRLLTEGLLVLAPESGITAMGPSAQVEALMTNYDPYGLKGNELQNGTEQYHRDPLILRWASKGNFAEYKVHVATKADFSDEMVHTTASKEYTLVNLLPATTYYWKVTADGFSTDVRSFTTEDTVRTVTIDGVDNSRDIGGYATGDNTRLKYGMVYRTATLDTITEDGLYQMLTVLGIKTELDVRTPGEGTAGGQSPLGTDINYINYSGPYYYNANSGILADAYQDALRAEIRAFADPDNYPIVVHCSVGRDRTGTILFLLEGLCGVSKEDLFFEYELSFLGRIGGNGANVTQLMNEVDKMYNGIQSWAPNGTFAEACEAFILSRGISQEEIDTIRELMTENVL